MADFKKGTKDKIRFSTDKGLLTIEQLWSLSTTTLDNIAVELDEELSKTKKSFLTEVSPKNELVKLKLDIVLEILNDKVKEGQAAQDFLAKKLHNDKINAIIAEKKEGKLHGMTIEELETLLM